MSPVAVNVSLRRSTRWCPTTEQVMLLEEMYKGGLRNPSATQIHQITAHLSRFGKVQGKNVFYWFQNHKARDKQRLKTKLIRKQSCYYGNLAEQAPASCISFTGPVMVRHQPETERVDATGRRVKPYNVGAMRENALIRSGMYSGHDHRNISTSMNVQDVGQITYIRSLIVDKSHRRLQTLNLFPVTTTHIKNQEEINIPCFDISDASSLECDFEPLLSLRMH